MVKYNSSLTEEQTKKWISALRSGEYKQCKGHLHQDSGYCCLGVLAKEVFDYKDSYLKRCKEGPLGVYSKLKRELGNDLVETVAVMNDKGNSFTEIAAFIEKRML